MLISLNWVHDFVELPADLDPRALAEKFTVTTAEVEGVEHVACDAGGLVAAEIQSVEPLPDTNNLFAVKLSDGGRTFDTVTAAQELSPGDRVIFAPPGARLPKIGEVTERKTAGRTSQGMIVDGDALSLATIGQRAVWLPPGTVPGTPIETTIFDDWIIEIDNKSITHRPDLWGHYGVARELAAIHHVPLQPYPMTPIEELSRADLPEIPIEIDDATKCPRYTGLRFTGVRPQPAPLWMQVRLAHVGLRPIDVLVDLTNYIMLELGQPMHAFDAENVDRIEVAVAKPGDKFTTLDGMQRTLPDGALMIQSHRRSVALAGIMGGADTEVTPRTTHLLLESANFEPATIRRCAAALGHRTDASARFEKSLDPANTVRAVQRFVHLARPELPDLKLTSRLSDAFPKPPVPTVVRVDPRFVSRYVGRDVPAGEIRRILEPLEFTVTDRGDHLEVTVPTFRATKDISIEADVVEEVARFIGYDAIEPVLPTVTVRYAAPDPMARLERDTLDLLCRGMSYAEIHRKIWFDDDWLRRLDFDPGATVRLKNPAAAGSERLRTTLIPGLLAAVDLNRHHHQSFELAEIGSVFLRLRIGGEDGDKGVDAAPNPPLAPSPPRLLAALPPGGVHGLPDREHCRLALALVAPGRKPAHEDALLRRLKTDLETWTRQTFQASPEFTAAESAVPWEHDAKTAAVRLDGQTIGRLTVVPAACKRRIDEHLAAWSVALAELDLTAVAARPPHTRKLVPIPVHPRIDLDFSVLAPAERRYRDIAESLAVYDHPLLRRFAFVDSFEGGSVPAGQRSFTFRATIGAPDRTLTEHDIQEFRTSVIQALERCELTLRT